MAVLLRGVGPTGTTVMTNCVFGNLTVAVFAAGSAIIEVHNSTFRNVCISEAQLRPLSTTPLTLSNVSISGVSGQCLNRKQYTSVLFLVSVGNSRQLFYRRSAEHFGSISQYFCE